MSYKSYIENVDDKYSFQSFGYIDELTYFWFDYNNKGSDFFKNFLCKKENYDLQSVCIAAADLLFNSKEAIRVFKERQRSIDLQILDIFGVFQALVAQQDAVNVFYLVCLKLITDKNELVKNQQEVFFWKTEDNLVKIRHIRNNLVGHPTNIRRPKRGRYVATTGMKIFSNNQIFYKLYDVGGDSNDSKHDRVDVQKCLRWQDKALIPYLKKIITAIENYKT